MIAATCYLGRAVWLSPSCVHSNISHLKQTIPVSHTLHIIASDQSSPETDWIIETVPDLEGIISERAISCSLCSSEVEDLRWYD